MKVHKDIAKQYTRPYWYVEVHRDPKFPADQYKLPLRNQSNNDEVFESDYVQLPCGSCKSENTKLIWVDEVLTNAGGTKQYEFKCEQCGVYTFYEESEYS